MAHKDDLRESRKGTVINKTSSRQEKAMTRAVEAVRVNLESAFPGISIEWKKRIYLKEVTAHINEAFPEVDTFYYQDSSFMTPDGGFLYLVSKDGKRFPILICEKKNQGTNDLRAAEGKSKQAKGNAIERLGKNVIGLRALMADEDIFPFVCFGDGCDFAADSSILDRVVTIAIFGELNKVYLHDVANLPQFKRGTFYFRAEEWTENEMYDRFYEIAKRSIHYYFSKYGENCFFND